METIKEDYVSLETAKLLKEKGFNEPCLTYFWEDENDNQIAYADRPFTYKQLYSGDILRPTHQMALKWLRDKHKIAINIRIVCKKTISYVFDIWDFNIIHPNKFVGGTIDLREQQFYFPSYEEATEEAIKYCLNNLI